MPRHTESRLICFGIAVINGALGIGLIPPLVHSFEQMHGFAHEQMGLILGVCGPISAVACLVGGVMYDRWGARWIVAAALALYAASAAGIAVSQHPAVFVAGLFGVFFCQGLASVINPFLGQLYGPEKTRGMNLLHACQGIGQFFAPLVIGACLAVAGKWQVAFIVSAVCYACASVLVLLRLEGPVPCPMTTQENQKQSGGVQRLWSVGVVIGVVGFFFLSGSEGAITNWTPSFLESEAAMPKHGVLVGYALMMAGCTLIRLLIGFNLVRIASPFMILTAVVYALSFTVVVGTRSATLVYPCLFLLGMAFGSYWPSAAAAVYDAAPRAHGRLTGLIVIISTSGAFVFISGVGWLGDRIGLGPGLWAAPAGACLFVLLFVIFRRLSQASRSTLTPTSCS